MTGSPSDSRPSSPASEDTVDVASSDFALTREDLAAPSRRWPKPLPMGDSPLSVWPAAIALVVFVIVASVAIELDHMPMIPFVLIAIISIRSWNQRWARTVWYATLTAYALWLVMHTVPLWLPFFFALLAAYILSPIVDPVERLFRRIKMPAARTASVVLFFIVGVGVLVAFDLFFIAQVRHTVDKLVEGVQERSITDSVVHNVEYIVREAGFDPLDEHEVAQIREWTDNAVANLQENLPKFGHENAQVLLGQAAQTVGWLVVLAFDFLIFLFATFYLLIGFPKMASKVDSYFSPERSQRLSRLSQQIGKILRSYLQGHTLACLLIGLLYFFILWLFGHPYAALLGLLMGVLSLIPFLGPIVAGLLSVLLTLTVGLEGAGGASAGLVENATVATSLVAVVVAYIVSHGLNDTVIYPQVAGRAVHISPVETLLVLFVIGHFFGILGMFFAVPLWAIVRKTVSWMNEEHIPGFEWLKLFRPYEVRHERTLRLQRAASERQAAATKAEDEWKQRQAQEEADATARAAADREQSATGATDGSQGEDEVAATGAGATDGSAGASDADETSDDSGAEAGESSDERETDGETDDEHDRPPSKRGSSKRAKKAAASPDGKKKATRKTTKKSKKKKSSGGKGKKKKRKKK